MSDRFAWARQSKPGPFQCALAHNFGPTILSGIPEVLESSEASVENQGSDHNGKDPDFQADLLRRADFLQAGWLLQTVALQTHDQTGSKIQVD